MKFSPTVGHYLTGLTKMYLCLSLIIPTNPTYCYDLGIFKVIVLACYHENNVMVVQNCSIVLRVT